MPHRREDSIPLRQADPFDRTWTEGWLRNLAEDVRHGTADRKARDLLLEALWPWALRTARAYAARLPPGADREAVCGEVLWEVFQAVRRMDWRRYDVWPALLKARLRNAWSTAARAADPLTRGERRARSVYLARVEAETQRLRRSLTGPERLAIARRVSLRGSASRVALGRSLVTTVRHCPESSEGTEPDPAELVQLGRLRRAVRTWVAHDLPAGLAREVTALLERDEGDRLEPDLLCRLAPYRPALAGRIAAETDGTSDMRMEPRSEERAVRVQRGGFANHVHDFG